MPSILRSRFALLALLGAFIIPISLSSLRSLTHVLTCEQEARTPFAVIVQKKGPPVVTTSERITRHNSSTLCGGLSLNMGAQVLSPTKVQMVLPITNRTRYPWRGTVQLKLGNTSIPVAIGSIPAGETATANVPFSLERGSHSLNGTLLIGP